MITCTFPGKYGDLLWALPTLRALARRTGHPIDLILPAALISISDLLAAQSYIHRVHLDANWTVLDTAPASPRIPPSTLNEPEWRPILNLGYTDWPRRPLPFETLDTYNLYAANDASLPSLSDRELDLQTPWISMDPVPWNQYRWPWVHGFTDEHFELKYGVVELLNRQFRRAGRVEAGAKRLLPSTVIGHNPRWEHEAGYSATSWMESVYFLRNSGALLACNSALHVLGVAVGTPVVLMEPNPHRHHEIFYPVGTEGPQVYLVRGNDGSPTFDARHVRDVLQNLLAARRSDGVDSAPPPTR